MPAELPFVGRRTEVAWFQTHLQMNAGGTILLTGEEGIGKSRLLQEWLAAAAASGRRVSTGRCPGAGQTPCLYPWRQALRPWGDAAVGQTADLPALAEALAGALNSGPAAVIALEDLQWADPASLELFLYLSAALEGRGPLLIATYRPEEAGGPLRELAAALVRQGAAYVALERFTEAEVREVTAAAGAPGAAGAVYARSSGIPLYAAHLATAPEGKLPPALHLAVQRRLGLLAPSVTEVMQIAAVIGAEFDVSTLERAGDLSEDRLLDALEAAVRAGVIREEGERFRFAHGLLREALCDGLLELKRRRWHRKVAAVVGDPDRAAYHLARAQDPEAVPHLREAGDRALRAGERGRAFSLYEQALALAQPDAELHLLAGAAGQSIDAERSLAHLEAAVRTGGDPVVTALAQYLLALQPGARSNRRGPRAMDEAHRLLGSLLHEPRLASLWQLVTGRPPHAQGTPDGLAQAYLWSGRPDEAEAIIRAAMADGGTAQQGPADQWVLAEAAWLRGDLAGAVEHMRRSAHEAVERRDYAMAAHRAAALLDLFLRDCGDRRADALALSEWAGSIARQAERCAGVPGLTEETALLGFWHWSGDTARLRSLLAAHLPGAGRGLWRPHLLEWQARLDAAGGDLEAAQRRFKELLLPLRPGAGPRYGDYGRKLRLMLDLSGLLRRSGDLAGAAAWLGTVDQWLAGRRPSEMHRAYSLVEWAELHRASGDSERARGAAESAAALGEKFGATTGVVAPARSILAALAKRVEEPPRRRSAEHPLLTPREAEVVRLVARGLTDREVGAELFLSPRTVDGHLRNVFAKLGVTSRTALAAWVARNGLLEG